MVCLPTLCISSAEILFRWNPHGLAGTGDIDFIRLVNGLSVPDYPALANKETLLKEQIMLQKVLSGNFNCVYLMKGWRLSSACAIGSQHFHSPSHPHPFQRKMRQTMERPFTALANVEMQSQGQRTQRNGPGHARQSR